MFFLDSDNVKNAIIIYISVVLVTYFYKPQNFFNESGDFKRYGLGDHETLFSFEIFCLVLAIVIFFVATLSLQIENTIPETKLL